MKRVLLIICICILLFGCEEESKTPVLNSEIEKYYDSKENCSKQEYGIYKCGSFIFNLKEHKLILETIVNDSRKTVSTYDYISKEYKSISYDNGAFYEEEHYDAINGYTCLGKNCDSLRSLKIQHANENYTIWDGFIDTDELISGISREDWYK